MTPEERTLITGLFDRLRAADAKAPAKDRDAEELIRQLTAQAPSAPYLLTQTTLVQEHALTNAQERIQTLEKQLAQAQQQQAATGSSGSGGFLAGLFGGHSSNPPPAPRQAPPPMPVQPPASPYPSTVNMPPSAGGGFLRNALSTAAGVAGGAMLFQGIQNLLGHNSGPFGSFGGGGSFLGGGTRPEITENREIVNNYYNDDSGGGRHHQGGGGAGGGDNDSDGIPQGAADQPTHAGHEDARFDNSNFDTSNPFDKPTDDSSLFAARDDSSLDNNYDLDNADAGGNDLGGSGDFVGGDNDNNDSSVA